MNENIFLTYLNCLEMKVHVAEPCHENWNNMSPRDQGRFCGSCEKMVVDFSKMTDQELIQHLSQSNRGICGRFKNDQLNRPIEMPKPKNLWKFPRFMMNSIAALFTTLAASLATMKAYTSEVTWIEINLDDDDEHPEKRTYFGTITAEGAPISGARVILVGEETLTTFTDSSGAYFFTIEWEEDTVDLQLMVEHNDYYSQSISISETFGAVNIELEPIIRMEPFETTTGMMMMGEMIIEEVDTEPQIQPGQEKVFDRKQPQNMQGGYDN